MSLRRTSFVSCLIVSVLCLAAGYGIAGQWLGAGIALLLGPAWWVARKYANSWLSFLCLLGSVGLAVAGTLTGTSSVLMIFGSAFALAVWDLLQFDSAMGKDPATEQSRRYEKEHLRSLTLALCGALVAILFGRSLRIQVPFIVLLASSAFLLFALDRVWSWIKKAG